MRKPTTYALVAGSLLATSVVLAVGGSENPGDSADAQPSSATRGVEMSQTASVVQKGVKHGSQLSLEKALDLIAQPRAGGGGGGSKSAAGIGGGGGPPTGGGSGDGNARNRMRGNAQQMMDTGS